MDESEARALREENARLKSRIADLERRLENLPTDKRPSAETKPAETAERAFTPNESMDNERLYQAIKSRLIEEAPGLIRVLAEKPELDIIVTRRKIEADGSSLKGRITRLMAAGFYDGGKTNSATRKELQRTGPDSNNANIGRVLDELVACGFLTRESGDAFTTVPDMRVNIVEK